MTLNQSILTNMYKRLVISGSLSKDEAVCHLVVKTGRTINQAKALVAFW